MRRGDIDRLADAIRRDHAAADAAPPEPWDAPPAVRIIDCVLSLNRNYQQHVAPRVAAFQGRHPEIRSCADLLAAVASAGHTGFARESLGLNDPGRAATIEGVAEHLAEAQQSFEGGSEAERLLAWAEWARPGDAYALEVRGFGVAGFQYLRMLFGADTVKPDVHIRRYVEGVLGRPVGDVALVGLLEAAAERLGRRAVDVDRALWAAATGAGA